MAQQQWGTKTRYKAKGGDATFIIASNIGDAVSRELQGKKLVN